MINPLSFSLADAEQELASKHISVKTNETQNMLNTAVAAGIVAYDDATSRYQKVITTWDKRNDAGTIYPLTPTAIAMYEDKFRNARNIQMTDTYLRDATLADFLQKAAKNSLSAAVTDTSLAHYVNANATSLGGITVGTIKTDTAILTYLISQVTTFAGAYRKWHEETCNGLIALFNKVYPSLTDRWTYGNSQKVVNLLVKYICVVSKRACTLGVLPDLQLLAQRYLNVYDELDIPVDRYIMRSSWNWNLVQPAKITLPLLVATHSQYYADRYVKNWSAWNYDEYNQFQASLHSAMTTPLDWEGYAWTEGKKENKYNSCVTNRKFRAIF